MARFRSKRFELGRKLGEGSLGLVYEAYDREQDIRVALKLLRRVVPTELYRLKQEFRALRSISHPNIVTLYDLLSEDDMWFISMELIEGEDMISHVRKTRAAHHGPERPLFGATVDESRLRHVLAQMAQALHAMHIAGLIHRDLKPSNVRVTELGRAVVMDFSIVAEASNILDHSNTGNLMLGTPLYMAPEQAAGDPPSPAIDWYGLGVMLYQAVTGRLPFEGRWDAVLIDKQERDPRPPRELVADMPDDLDELCHALLSRRPHERPPGHEILARLGLASEDTASVLHGMNEGVFVGRDSELALLDHACERAREGESVCVLFGGVPGVGKSKLLQRFATRRLRSPGEAVIVLSGSCQPHDPRCYNALDEIIDALSRALLELPGERLRAVLPEDIALAAGMFPALLRVPGVDRPSRRKAARPDERRDRAVDALRRLLADLAAWRPLVVCIDDLQWADADSLDALRALFRPPALGHVLWVLAVEDHGAGPRSEAERLYQALDLGASGTCHLVELAGLPRDAQQALLEHWLGARAAVLESMSMDQARATPLYLSELARLAIESRTQGGGSFDTLDQVLEQRIAMLPESGRALLEAICLAGQPAPLSLLARATHQGMGEVERASATLRASRLIRVARPGREPWLIPYHHTVSEIACRMLPDDHRRDLHHRLALALERLGGAPSDALARHWRASGDAEQALAHLGAAARNAAERLAFERAAELYGAARDLTEPQSPAMRSLLRSLGHVLSLCGRHVEAADVCRQAARQGGAELSLALERQAADHLLRGGHIAAGLDQLGAIAARLGAPPGQAGAAGAPLRQRVRLLMRKQRYRARSEKEIAARDLDRLDIMYATALPLSMLDHGRGVMVQSEHLIIALRLGEPVRVARALACQVPAVLLKGGRHRGRHDRARSLARDALDTARRMGDAHLAGLAHLGLGLTDLAGDHHAAAEPSLARAVHVFATEVRDAHWELLLARYLHCVARIGQGRIREATAVIPGFLARARQRGDVTARTLFGCRPAMWRAMRRDRVDQALDAIAALRDSWRDQPTHAARYLMAVAQVMGHIYLGDRERARAAMNACAHHMQGAYLANTPLLAVDAHALAGRVALLCHDRDQAARAARKLARMSGPMARGHAALINAALAHGDGDHDRAKELLGEAATRFHGAGASHLGSAARFRLGQMLGAERGKSHIAKAMQWCRRENIANIGRMFDYLCPWTRSTVDV
jgi:eukaryotic-like serine/threonine-protein kinase